MKKFTFILLILSLSASCISAKKKDKVSISEKDSVENIVLMNSTSFTFPMILVGNVSFLNGKESEIFDQESANDSTLFLGMTKKQLVDFFVQNVIYPIELRQKGVEEYLMVRFNVDKAGKIKSPKVLYAVSPEMEKEALRVVEKLPSFAADSVAAKSKKGKRKVQSNEATIEVPISFRLLKL